MPDIFGREAHDYAHIRDMQAEGLWERHQQAHAELRPASLPQHDFTALASGVPAELQRATQDQQAVGFLTNNMLAIQSMADEVLYTAYRLPDFVSLNTMIEEGARSYGVRVRDRRGRADRISGPGYEAPSAIVSESLPTQTIEWYGLDAEWSIDELRGAMMAGTPLDTETIEAAVTGTMETMEAVGLTGGGYDGATGLLNHATASAASATQVQLSTQGSNMTFADIGSTEIRTLINGEISGIISGSMETLGRNISEGMTVYLPGEQYDLLTTLYIGDDARQTLMKSILADNPWTHFTKGKALMIERVLELAGIGGSSSDRMVVGLKHPRVAEMGVSIQPRVLRVMDKGRVVCAQVEAKFSELFMKRTIGLRYTDAI